MKANELRIGNWVTATCCYDDKPIRNIEYSQIDCGFEDFLEPIPLTGEWLLKFGFEKAYKDRVFKFNDNFGVDFGISIFFIQHYKNEVHNSFIRTEIYYVHQLQNLYFALTGEELVIDEEQK